MPNKKKRRKLRQQREKQVYVDEPIKLLYKITKTDEILEITNIYCDVCNEAIDCGCIAEQHLPNFKRLCAKSENKEIFPRSQFMMKGKQFDIYVIYICSLLCDEKFKLTATEYLSQIKKYNPEINVFDFI